MDTSEQLDMKQTIGVLRRQWWIVCSVPIIVTTLVVSLSVHMHKSYQATAILLTGQTHGIADLTTMNEAGQATQSLRQMITDRVVVSKAMSVVGVVPARGRALPVISAKVPPNTQEIVVTVTDQSPAIAEALANGIADTFSAIVSKSVSANSNLSVSVWQRAKRPTGAASPNVTLNGVLALIIGSLLGIGIAFLCESVGHRWRSDDDIEMTLGIPVLSSVPPFRNERHGLRARTGKSKKAMEMIK